MVTKRKGWERMGGEGGRRGLKGIMIGTHGVCVCVGHGEDSVA